MQNVYEKTKSNLEKITGMKHFEELYVAVIACIAFIGWMFSIHISMIFFILIALITVIFLKNLRYIIPCIVYAVFSLGEGFSSESLPIGLMVEAGIFVLIILVYTFKSGFKFKRLKSIYGLMGFAIMNFLPIFWCRTITDSTRALYFLFFMDFCYLLVYIVLANGIKNNCLMLLAKTMAFLGILLTIECVVMVYRYKDTVENIFMLWYYMGWGLCNEAGIMICVSIPFIFYLMAKSGTIKGILYQNLKVLFCIVGLLLTTSRGAYIFGFIEVGLLYVVLLFCSKRIRAYQNLFLLYSIILISFVLIYKNDVIKFAEEIYHMVFDQGLSDNGRVLLWESAVRLWKETPLNQIFGAGYNGIINQLVTANGVQLAPQVFHSTFFETLAMGGIFGMICLFVHFVEKYVNLFLTDKLFFVIIGIGYVLVDAYGMIDNTYHMYYYMIPLVVIMAVVDTSRIPKKKEMNYEVAKEA